MDLVYLSDVMAYQAIRGPIYDRYDQKWDQTAQKGNVIKVFEVNINNENSNKMA